MLGSTLELRIEPNLFGAPGDKNHGRAVTDEDLGWLSPRETLRPRLPNSYGLSDEHVSRLCLQMYKELGAPRDEALLAVGALARLEANIADSFVGVGCAYADLIDASGQQDGSSLRELLEPTDILGDPDLLQALKLWQEERHDVRFWSDDEGTRLKAPRLVGAYLLRKRGEVLSQLTRPLSFECSVLSELLELIDQIRDSLNERQRLIRDYFPAHAKTFATSFLVKRGINAAPGFFWLEAMREEL